MKYVQYMLIVLILFILFAGCAKENKKDLAPGIYAQMVTNRGSFIIRLEYEKVPMLVANFIGLAEGTFAAGITEDEAGGYYDNSHFYEVAVDVLVKGGKHYGENSSTSTYNLPKNYHPELMHDRVGAVSMLKDESAIHGSRFSIALKNLPWLDYNQPVFGYVVDGMKNLKAIKPGDILKNVMILRIGEQAAGFIVTREYFTELRNQVEANNLEKERARNREVIPRLKEKWPNLIQTRSGIYFTIVKQGTGRTPAAGTEVTVKYTGTLIDGTVFIDTAKEGGTKKLIVGGAIKGLNEALLTMRKGEQRIVIIPPELGFGEAGLTFLIPPNSFLVFDLELIDF